MKGNNWWRSFAIQLLPFYGLLLVVFGIFYWLIEPGKGTSEEQLRSASGIAGQLLMTAIGAGVAAMATVQFWKVAFMPRARFHFAELKTVFKGSLEIVLGGELTPGSQQKRSYAGYDVLLPDSLKDLLDNPTEVIMGQVRSAADFILMHPKDNERTLQRLAGANGESAVEAYLTALESKDSEDDPDELLSPVRFFVDQHLNLLHVRLRERWRRKVRLIAVLVAGGIGALSLTLSDLSLTIKVSVISAALVWGGFFAWFARDLVAIVERRRS